VLAAKAGIDLLMEVGIAKIADQVKKLTTRCLDGLAQQRADIVTPQDPNQRAGVIAVKHPRLDRIFAFCRNARVDVGVAGNLRIDPHAFNNEDDIDRFLGCFARINRSGKGAS
jgi:selenocysteine lyase/cysteine desulfurase